MKRLIALLLCLMPVLGMAEPLALPDDSPMMEEMQLEEGAYLRRYTAPDGQEILYTALCEEEYVYAEDVNFDGIDDLVALTHQGASNAGYAFFVSTDEGYQLVMTDEALFNYQLLPELNAVMTWVDEGWAGALCRMNLYVWEDGELHLVRMAASADAGSDRLAMYVTDLTGDEPLIAWQAEVPVLAEDAVRVELENMKNALTQGMPVISAE